MNRISYTTLALTLGSLLVASTAHAQATRTWVSGVGDDVNPCSRTAPCKTFAGAISKTAAGGEISVLDPGGYGAVTITKSMTISGDGTLAGVSFGGANGIVVNDSAGATPGSIVVTLRNLSLLSVPTVPGLSAISMVSGAKLIVDHVSVVGGQNGIQVTRGTVVVTDSTINYTTSFGIRALTPAAPEQAAQVSVERTSFVGNSTAAQVDAGASMRFTDSAFYGNSTAFGCGGGTLLSAGDNRKAANANPGCSPTVAVTIQ